MEGCIDMGFYDKAKEIESYIVDWRRHFHAHPELSGKEFETLKTLKAEFDNLGIEYVEVPEGGLLGKIVGNLPGDKSIMLRADIDALPVIEQDDNLAGPRMCKSTVDGVMHACGHDGHMAMLLGAAKLLIDKKDEFGGTVYLCLERGEEGTGNFKYIFAYMEKHGINPDAIFAIHLLSTLKTGIWGISDGPMMAAAQGFNITIEGKGGHGSRPDQSINPIDAFAAIYNYLENFRLAKINPFETLTYSVGLIEAGNVPNVIPQTLTFGGSARFFNREEVGLPFHNMFKEKVVQLATAYDCTVRFNSYPRPIFAVMNDKDCAVFAREHFAEEFGEENVIIPEPWMASESYSMYLQQWPGIFAFLGMENEEKGVGAAHHNHLFDVDEDVLKMGAAGAANYAFNFLNSDFMPAHRPYRGKVKELLLEAGNSEEVIKEVYETIG